MFVLKERYRKLKRNENKLIINYFLKKNNIQKVNLEIIGFIPIV